LSKAIAAIDLAPGLSWGPVTMSDQFLILTVVPEPGTMGLLITGAFGLLLLVRRRRQRGSRR